MKHKTFNETQSTTKLSLQTSSHTVANSQQLFPILVRSIQKGNAERITKHSTNRIGLLFPGSRGVTLLSNPLDAAVILIQESMFGDQGFRHKTLSNCNCDGTGLCKACAISCFNLFTLSAKFS
jgi:hypothetical protein